MHHKYFISKTGELLFTDCFMMNVLCRGPIGFMHVNSSTGKPHKFMLMQQTLATWNQSTGTLTNKTIVVGGLTSALHWWYKRFTDVMETFMCPEPAIPNCKTKNPNRQNPAEKPEDRTRMDAWAMPHGSLVTDIAPFLMIKKDFP